MNEVRNEIKRKLEESRKELIDRMNEINLRRNEIKKILIDHKKDISDKLEEVVKRD